MAARTKRIFISDIHLGDERSMEESPHHYCWVKDNISVLEKFLKEQREAPDVKEMVILGDLFDTWLIPVKFDPLTSFEKICLNPANQSIMANLNALIESGIKLIYVPGNHDMAMDFPGISAMKLSVQKQFPGINCLFSDEEPLGRYNIGTLLAEHGNRYCLFNGPDTWAKPNCFLPLGYFIARIIAHYALNHGQELNYRHILGNFINGISGTPDILKNMFIAIAAEGDLKPNDSINTKGIPGYPAMMTVDEIGEQFSNLVEDWSKEPGNIDWKTAGEGDLGSLWLAASRQFQGGKQIVIFGHTHKPEMHLDQGVDPGDEIPPWEKPSATIYANSGAWVDRGKYGCTYVETEEVEKERRYYVRLKKYPGNNCINEGFVLM